MTRTLVISLILWLFVASAGIPTFSSSVELIPPPIFADGQFVNGPNVGAFDVTAYLRSVGSPLLPYAEVIRDKASYYSINPRLLLAVIEWRSGLVTGQPQVQAENPLALPSPSGFEPQIETLVHNLFDNFYDRLYPSPSFLALPHKVKLATGERIELSLESNAASFALISSLAPLSTAEQWSALKSPTAQDGFTQTYGRLFPESDPLDNSNVLMPEALPPTDLLKFPFSGGDTWNFSGGPHEYDGTCDGSGAVSSVDFAPGVPHCTIPPDRWVTAPAAGTVAEVSCGACQVIIDHGGGWSTKMYHLANNLVSLGQVLTKDQRIANPSCRPYEGGSCGSCGGYASGTHVHMGLRYNGAYVNIEGTTLEGWVVHDEPQNTCYDGYLQRGLERIEWNQPVYSAPVLPDITPPVTTHSLTATSGENGWYLSNVQVSLSGSDIGTGLRGILYKLDAGGWVTYTVPLNVSGDGMHTLIYYSKDNAGNLENENRLLLPVDSALPGGSLSLNNGASLSYSSLLWLRAAGSDSLSGPYFFRLRDAGGGWDLRSGKTLSLLWLLPNPTTAQFTIEANSKDQAGNISNMFSAAINLVVYPTSPISANFRLPASTFSAGGGVLGTPSYRLRGSLGQTSPLGRLTSANFILNSGFILTLAPLQRPLYMPLIRK